MKRDFVEIDIGRPGVVPVRQEHEDTHERLYEWSRFINPLGSGGAVHPMFRQFKTTWKPGDAAPNATPDQLLAMEVENKLRGLPSRQQDALRWAYVYVNGTRDCKPVPLRRILAYLRIERTTLVALIHDARGLLASAL